MLGLGERAGLNIEGEFPGVLASEPPKFGGVGMMTSFGEGIQLTALQLASLLSAIDRARTKASEELGKLAQKLRVARQNREGTGLRQIRNLCACLRPRSRLQERVLGPLMFLVTHGPSLGATLVDAADPFSTEHGILEL